MAEVKWNSTGELLQWAARQFGDRQFIIFEDQEITFGEANELANRFAGALIASGLNKGDRVAVMLPNGVLFPVLWLAIGRAGLVMTPINTEYMSHDLEYVLNDSGASCLIIHEKHGEAFQSVENNCRSLRKIIRVAGKKDANDDLQRLLASAPRDFKAPDISSSDLVNIQYTSGTTGFPKGCMLSHKYWLLMGRFASEGVDTRPGDVHLNVQPFYYMDGQWNVMLSLMTGTPLVLTSRFSASNFWKTVNDYGITYFYCIGTMPVMLLNREPDPLERSHKVRAVACSGIPKELHAKIEERFHCPWREGYGSTESGTDLLVPFEDAACVGTGALGKPVPTKETRIVDPEGREVPAGETGELIIRGEPMMQGYWNNPEATAKTIQDGWYHTGDLFTKDAEGNHFIVGRLKDMVRRGGENISAAEVESVLMESPDVQLAAVVPVPDTVRGEEVKAYIVLAEHSPPSRETAARILEFARRKLAAFKAPRFIQFMDSLPLTASERVEKHKLLKLSQNPREDSYDDASGNWWNGEQSTNSPGRRTTD